MANHLARETSPYLLQHADNPVDWYPWSEEALEKARREDKPIFLSIGYAACHWCHVMAHESFEDKEVAALLNEHFVSIKVDREERPDLDRIYMAAVQAIGGHGGWPMSVFLTPDGKPFYAGTYFPPVPRRGLPSFTAVLQAVREAWRNHRQELEQGSTKIAEFIARNLDVMGETAASLDANICAAAVEVLAQQYDAEHGGWGAAPKFPQPMTLEFLLRYYRLTSNPQVLGMVTKTLESMARGGIYDQVGGGFHRYAVDDRWLVPHFEKMLYDNAQLARVYLHAWQVTGQTFFRDIAQETLDYVLREMTDAAGGFYASQDADSEGKEGRFYLWTPQEIRQILGAQAQEVERALGVSAQGNFEGRNILTYRGPLDRRDTLAPARRLLLEARRQRIPPARDEKVLTSWNGLMLAALAEAGRVLGRQDYICAAERNAAFLWSHLRDDRGRLYHTWRAGQAKVNGLLEDYVYLAEGLLALYRATFVPRWLRAARELMDLVLARFGAPQGFYDTSDDHEALLVRPRELQDNAVPSGNALAVTVLFHLAELTLEQRYAQAAETSLRTMGSLLGRYPLAFSQWLCGLTEALAPKEQVVVLGPRDLPEAQALVDVLRADDQPGRVVAWGWQEDAEDVPLLRGYEPVGGRPRVYVCRQGTCYPPVTEVEDLRQLLGMSR